MGFKDNALGGIPVQPSVPVYARVQSRTSRAWHGRLGVPVTRRRGQGNKPSQGLRLKKCLRRVNQAVASTRENGAKRVR